MNPKVEALTKALVKVEFAHGDSVPVTTECGYPFQVVLCDHLNADHENTRGDYVADEYLKYLVWYEQFANQQTNDYFEFYSLIEADAELTALVIEEYGNIHDALCVLLPSDPWCPPPRPNSNH